MLHFLGPGEVFNAVGVFASPSNPASIIALEKSTVWVIRRDTVIRSLDDHPHLAHAVIQDLAGRVLHLIQSDKSRRQQRDRMRR